MDVLHSILINVLANNANKVNFFLDINVFHHALLNMLLRMENVINKIVKINAKLKIKLYMKEKNLKENGLQKLLKKIGMRLVLK